MLWRQCLEVKKENTYSREPAFDESVKHLLGCSFGNRGVVLATCKFRETMLYLFKMQSIIYLEGI